MFRIENDKKFGLPVFEDGCVVVAGKVWLEYVTGLTIIEIVGTRGSLIGDPSLFRTESATNCKEYLKRTIKNKKVVRKILNEVTGRNSYS